MANNQNQKNNETTEQVVNNQPVQNTVPAQTEPTPVPQQTAAVAEQKKGFGGWLKQHWKGAVATITGAFAVGGSAFVAYRKGKQAGMAVPMPQQPTNDDYSLNPNE